jgi:hypothetical protein
MPADETPTELFTPEQVAAAYREALAGVPYDLPDAQKLDAMFQSLGTTDPFKGD